VFVSLKGNCEMSRHKTGLIVLLFGVVLSILVPERTVAQEFKLPSLFPFKKQTPEVKPFQLTDQAKGKPGLFPNRPLMNLFHTEPKPNQTPNAMNNFSQKSKSFFARTGEGISKFTSDMRDSLKNLESPGWEFDKKTHWWNDEPDVNKLQSDLNRLKWHTPQSGMPPQPQPRTAQGLQTTPPRHRF
jgi:hypothetical protein